MNEKQLAERLRKLAYRVEDRNAAEYSIRELADELDPPRPEPGTVVWYLGLWDDVWHMGIVEEGNRGYARTQWGGFVSLDKTEWKPAHILGPRQVAVDIPPAREWPETAVDLTLYWTPTIRRGKAPHAYPYKTIITREEAERMEVSDE